MATSSRYKALRKAVTKSRHALLPSKFDPTGTYRSQDRVHLRTISFRIIVHAEIEAFLEDRSHELVFEAWKHWQASRVPSEAVIGLLAFSEVALSLPPKSLNLQGKKSYDDMGIPLQSALNSWMSRHGDNHGIKEPNVLSLFLPLGILHTKLDTTLLADLSSYGTSRGEVAHKSNYIVNVYADPKDEYLRATKLVKDLQKLDQVINEAISRTNKLATIK